MKKSFFLILVFWLVSNVNNVVYSLEEHEQKPISLGIYGNLNFNFLSPEFYLYPPNVNTTPYLFFNKNSLDLSGSLGLIGNFPINELFTISGRVGYNKLYGISDDAIGTTKFTTSIDYFELSPILKFYIPDFKELYLLGGFEFGFPFDWKYTINENGIASDSLTFSDPGIRSAIVFGAGYDIELSPYFTLTPEASFRFPFTALTKEKGERNQNYYIEAFNVPQLRVGISLTYNLKPREEREISLKSSELNVAIREIRTYDDNGKPILVDKITVEDVQYTELFPLIPYIFFEENSSRLLPQNHIIGSYSEAGEFKIENLPQDATYINQRLLDVVGKRLKDNPGTELTLIGTRDNKFEEKNKNLSEERANFVKNYLIQNWNISPELINVRATGMPSKPSTMNDPDGIAENRRVELTSSNPKILEPILIVGENQRLAYPRLIEFVPSVYSTDSITYWEFNISQAGNILKKFDGTGYPKQIMWNIYPNELTNRNIPVDYNFIVYNSAGLNKRASGSIPVDYISQTKKKEQNLPDKIISRFSLVLFDFDKAEVSSGDLAIINKYIIPVIKYNSTVKIYGYTDRIGNADYNKNLAYRRAVAVKNILEQKIKSARYEVYAKGEDEPIFNQNLAIGRQLSRTVIIEVITPK